MYDAQKTYALKYKERKNPFIRAFALRYVYLIFVITRYVLRAFRSPKVFPPFFP